MEGRYQTILAGTNDEEKLKSFWLEFFTELPTCREPGCQHIAMEVDAFFPYLDDNNRCQMHLSLELAKQIAPAKKQCTQNANNGHRHKDIRKIRLWRSPGAYQRHTGHRQPHPG